MESTNKKDNIIYYLNETNELLKEIKLKFESNLNLKKEMKFISKLNEEINSNSLFEPIKILFWGKTNSGKTTLINSIIENIPIKKAEQGFLPIKAIAETANFFFLSLSNENEYNYEIYKDEKIDEKKGLTREEFKISLKEFVDKQKEKNKNIDNPKDFLESLKIFSQVIKI